MKLNETSKFITLDWDDINLQEALQKVEEIKLSPNVVKVRLDKSARKGYHCRVWFMFRVRILLSRFNLGDDPRRILHDLLNRPDYIHDILWTRKTIGWKGYTAQEILTYEKI